MTGPPVLWHFPISHYDEKGAGRSTGRASRTCAARSR